MECLFCFLNGYRFKFLNDDVVLMLKIVFTFYNTFDNVMMKFRVIYSISSRYEGNFICS